jgi:hypothetical protein
VVKGSTKRLANLLVPHVLPGKPVEVDFTSVHKDLHLQIVYAPRVILESTKHLEPLLVMHATSVPQVKAS